MRESHIVKKNIISPNHLEQNGQGKNIIISLTSYPARINSVHVTIESLLNQTKKADKIILWLAPEQFPNKEKDLPQQLLDLISKGLTIDWYHDIKSYKKLIPTLKKYPEDIIVTVDDDVDYSLDLIATLFKGYLKNPKIIQANRCRKVQFKGNKFDHYKDWFFCDKYNASYLNFFTGIGGVLYPPQCLDYNILNEDLF